VRKFSTLLRSLKQKHGEVAPPVVTPETPDAFDDLVHELVYSMLLWECSSAQARAAHKRIRDAVVDYNELRVCVPDEISALLGERYPLAAERAVRLRSSLNDIFRREHGVRLAHLAEHGKREARAYLEGIDGLPPFVAARLIVVRLGGHAMPTDERLRDLLADKGILPPQTAVHDAAGWLEHRVKAGDAREAHLLLQAWSDECGRPPRRDMSVFEPPPILEASPSAPPPAPIKSAAKSPRSKGGARARS
jgi:hypothetical protein